MTDHNKDGAKCGCSVLEERWLNVSLNELYPDKINKNKGLQFLYNFFFFLCNSFFLCWQQNVIDIFL